MCPGLAPAIEAAGTTITQAARALGWQRSRVSNWVSQGEGPKAELERLAKHLGTTLEQLAEARPVDPVRDALERLTAAEGALQVVAAEVGQARAALAKLRRGG